MTKYKNNIIIYTFTIISSILLIPQIRIVIIDFIGTISHHYAKDPEWWSDWMFPFIFCFFSCCTMTLVYTHSKTTLFFKNLRDNLFQTTLILFFFISNIQISLNGNFKGYANIWDFADFTSAIIHYGNVQSLYGTNYPPLAVLIFKLMYQLIPTATIENSYAINYVLTLYILIVTISLLILFQKLFEFKKKQSTILSISLFLSGPILFTYQRMNLMFIALIFTLIFYIYYQSQNKYLKEIAIISLAIAANIKLFPAIFGLLLIKSRQKNLTIRCIIYGICLFALPVLISNGNTTHAPSEIANFYNSSTQFASTNYYLTICISLKAIVYRFLNHYNYLVTNTLLNISLIISTIIIIACFFITKKKYQEYLLLVFLCVLLPTTSFWYSLVFFIIPIVEFEKTKTDAIVDYITLWLFSFIFVYVVGYWDILQPHAFWHLGLLLILTISDIIANYLKHTIIQKQTIHN